jgi:hypothetical protein
MTLSLQPIDITNNEADATFRSKVQSNFTAIAAAINGFTGPTGPTGPTGTGPTGPTGAGPTGPTGPTGP